MAPLAERFDARFGRKPEVLVRAPGRVNLIGEHIDYNGGLVLPLAINRYVTIALARRSDRDARLFSETLEEETRFRVGAPRLEAPHWSNYARGVSALLRVSGFDALVASNLPAGAGLSSSAAFEVALAKALQKAFFLPIDAMTLARLCQKAEHDFAGVRCGIMDQVAVTFARPGHALLLDCRTATFSYVPLDARGVCFAICDTQVRRALASSEYNVRRRECDRALGFFRSEFLAEVSPVELRRRAGAMPDVLRRRSRHVVTEQKRVRAAVRALERRDFDALGRLLDASHRSLSRDYEVSSKELDVMARLARSLPGCLGARMVGAGFGGAVLALLRTPSPRAFAGSLARAYFRETGVEPEIRLLRVGR